MLEGVWLQWRGVAGQRARTGAYLGTDPGADAGPNPGAPSGAGSGSGSGSDNEPDAGLRADPGSDTRGPGAGIRVERLWGAPREALDVQERGLRYRVHPGLHRNAGLFLDAAPARAWLRETAAGLRVLNLFAYTCSFSVAALAGGARDVVNLDMAAGALAIGRHNHRLNALAGATFLSHELFRSWGALRRRGPFDLVVVDPPSFQRGSFEADRHWPRLLGRLPGLLSGSGRVLVCLNSPFHGLDQLDAWRQDHAPGLFLQESLPRSPQFPEVDPDRGLKVQVWSAAVSPAPAAARRA